MHDVYVRAKDFGPQMRSVVVNRLHQEVEGRTLLDAGFVVCVVEVLVRWLSAELACRVTAHIELTPIAAADGRSCIFSVAFRVANGLS